MFITLVCIIIIILILNSWIFEHHEDYKNVNICDFNTLQQVERNVVQDNDFKKVKGGDWDVWYPCGYNNAQNELDSTDFSEKKSGHIMMIDGIDNIAAKNKLWELIYNYYGREADKLLVPNTWLSYDKAQMAHYKEYTRDNPGKMYLRKKNIQRQQGIDIFTDPKKGFNASNEGYVVIQELLEDPYILNGLKINIRVYILITCQNNVKKIYMYTNGFMYYSKVPYTDGKTYDQIITTGYIDRKVYQENPLTLEDFYVYLDKKHGFGTFQKFVNLMFNNIKAIFKAVQVGICNKKLNSGVTMAQLYGSDMQPNGDLTKIVCIEKNKGMSLSVMDSRDGAVKQKMIQDAYSIIGLTEPTENNKFVQLA
jgi:hypothetical protein